MSQRMPLAAAYKLLWDAARFERLDYEEDIYLDDFSQSIGDVTDLTPVVVAAPVLYQADLTLLPLIDYPYPHSEQDLGVMSKRMLAVLQLLKAFGCREIPIAIKDWSIKPNRNLPINTDYTGVQLTEYADVFDYENSVYERRRYAVPNASGSDNADAKDWFVSNVTEFAFRVPPAGLPPIFRVSESQTTLFISHAARLALKAAKVTGVQYESLKGFRYGEVSTETDVPVTLPDK